MVEDEDERLVVNAASRLPAGERPADIDWAVNPEIDSISDQTAGEIQEVLGELRENLWVLDRIHRER